MFEVAVPVLIDAQIPYALLVVDDPSLITGLLLQQLLPEGWHVSVRDSTGKTFVRNDATDTDLTYPLMAVPVF